MIADIRYAFRTLLQARGFAMVAILTLALGIGANTAMFSVVNAVLLRPLPFPHPDRLMSITTLRSHQGALHPTVVSYPDFIDYRARNHSFEDMASYYGNDFSLLGTGEAVQLRGQVVGTAFFNVLQVKPALGRTFVADEDQPGHDVAVISHALWASRFGSDPKVTDRTISLSGKTYSVIGVAPQGFQFPIGSNRTDVWVSAARDAEVDTPGEKPAITQRGAHYLYAIGRLKPGVSREQAQADLSSIALSLSKEFPDSNTTEPAARVEELLSELVGDTKRPLLILLAAVACVLLIACANVANLVIARSTSRSREIAVRAALGASRGRIIRQLVTESLVLAFIGAILGTGIAKWAMTAVVGLYPHNLPRAEQVGIDPVVLAFTAAVTIITAILFGLVPALESSRLNLSEAMREGGRGAIGTSRNTRLRSVLVVAETAMGVMLLIGAGLLIRSMNRLAHVDLGLNTDHVLTANFDLSQTRYNAEQQDRFYRELLDRIRALPGVESASATGQMPLANDDWSISFNVLEHPLPKSQQPSAAFYVIATDFFKTLKIPLMSGRLFNEHDTRDSHPVMIVNQEYAKQYFPNEDPLGKMVEIGAGDGQKRSAWKTREIVGVVGNIRSSEIGAPPRAAYFVPMPQLIWGPPTLVIRTAGDPNSLVSAVRKTLAAMEPDAPLYDVRTLDDYLALDLGRARFQTVLLSLFAAVALVLTAIGLYGVIAYGVVQRTHEIGVRMALGASRTNVLKMILNRGLMLTVSGIVLGVVGALALARLMESLLYEIPPRDPLTYVVVCFTLSMVALLASYIPALRATRVDPMIALRYE